MPETRIDEFTNESFLFKPEHLADLCYESYIGLKDVIPDLEVGATPYIFSEITASTKRSLGKKYPNLHNGYNAEKLAGFFCFWICKLKPFHAQQKTRINEAIGLLVGSAIIYKRCGIVIQFPNGELLDAINTLRYHTSSPHMLTLLFQSWKERSK